MKRRYAFATKQRIYQTKRLIIIAIGMFCLFCLALARFYKIQIIEGEKWEKEAIQQHYRDVTIPFSRGVFYSNTEVNPVHNMSKQPFVINVPTFHMYIDPSVIPEKDKNEIIEKLLTYVFVPKEMQEKWKKNFYKKSRSRKLNSYIDPASYEKIMDWWKTFAKSHKIHKNAVYFIHDYKRCYPFQTMLGQVLHTVREEKDKNNQNIPTGGLEYYFHKYLSGKEGKKVILRSPRNSLEIKKILENSENGADIYLTVNHVLQAICEEELEKGVKNAKAKGGWALMMDPYTGELLAIAQYPFFDLTHFSDYYNDSTLLEQTKIKSINDAFEPASIMKPITFAICLKANEELMAKGEKPLFDPDEMLKQGDGRFPGRPFPIKDGRRHKYLNMNMAIQKSSNIYPGMIIDKVMNQFGESWYRKQLVDIFGFGRKTGIELPGESIGLVPRPGKLHPNGTLEWSKATPYSLAIGHNISVNSMQILQSYAMIVNGGFSVQPTIVKKIVRKIDDDKEEIIYQRSKKQMQRVLSLNSAQKLMKAMKYTTKYRGTSPRGDIYGYSEGGKSGTSEKLVKGRYSHFHYISSFVGFAPASSPKFVLLISIDEPQKVFIPGVGKNHNGGICAAPIFSNIGKRALAYLGVAPDDAFGYPYGDRRRDVSKADWIEEVNELNRQYSKWNQ
ncbi:MAG TPA: penicillin-binding protein 2 [Chlamydiales bacterium]|nr:penicillin-binding protein 2 [Chlamydiales bacterium]